MKKILTLFSLIPAIAFSQDTSRHSNFSLSGYIDVYAAYYSDSAGAGDYQKYPTVSPRSGQAGLSIALLSAKYDAEKVRGTVTLHYGDIPRSSWSGNFNMLEEANVGIRLSKKLWLDGGFFRSHIGCEGLFPKENITSSIAITTWFEPYFESGFKLNYAPTEKLTLNLFALNGYNIFEDNNKKKSAGFQATYVCSDKLTLCYCDYLGDDSQDGDSISHLRFFNNLFLNYKTGKIKIVAGGDLATQQNSGLVEANKPAMAFGGLIAISFQATKKFGVYGRGEIFNDDEGILSGVFVDDDLVFTGLKIWGATLGVEYKPTENSYIRLEGRNLSADNAQKIFYTDHQLTNSRMEAMINIGVWFP